jgi:GR25 family glycosyltransferase involved in LPS biosynthesis
VLERKPPSGDGNPADRDARVASAVVINLDASAERLNQIQRQFSRLRLTQPRRIPAIKITLPYKASEQMSAHASSRDLGLSAASTDLNPQQLARLVGPFFTDRFQFRGDKGLVKLGDLSVALSHLRAWFLLLQGAETRALQRGRGQWHLILEDDAVMELPAHALAPRIRKGPGASQTQTLVDGGRQDGDMVLQLEGVPEVMSRMQVLPWP